MHETIEKVTTDRKELLSMLKRLSDFGERTRLSGIKRAQVEQEAINLIEALTNADTI